MKKSLFAVVTLLFAVALVSFADTAKKPVPANTFTTENGQTWFSCPVEQSPTPVAMAAAKSVVDGKAYYHCCASSQAKFRANPQAYLGESFFLPMNLVSYSQAEGAVFRDPVNGETAKLSAETAYHDARKHHRYFFTSQKTRDQFAADPERYLDTDQAQK